ncbi:hypothetical protein MYCTH_108504 [Thermothelomyces thermophilus ATCC 42464]|uniref:Uncharacterized protein n=1 Tax=Thermothelomyces thermophilus (strain ATCC 42464 / BCRC 31852 / DSM 1799) TaxID=573729 RepID=G2QI67_THET4|nr:uncharacterized protein MYCTH_108504 [Thermothelomyces thermophilus ATCC 42464]AEO60256.1 hypothetical protein MYCTH_108504 [Thermothelomyces thermophilus ATCC 42464]
MPTLRERPNRGETSPAKKASQNSPTATRSTPRKRRSSMANDAIEVRESIEAKGDVDEDVEMEDADSPAHREDDEMVVNGNGDQDADADADADGEPDDMDEQARQEEELRNLLQLIRDTSEYLCRYTIKVDGEDHEIASGFQRLVNKRSLPDYFEVIKEPMAFSTIRAKLGKKAYTKFSEFVHDVTRICHNAQVYNRPSAPIFSDAGRLLQVFKEKLAEMKKRGRPPKVFTPLEARIQAILKGLRRFRNENGQLRILHFERLPDKAELPEYYAAIRNPIALDTIKKKHKRKWYQSVDQALQDLELMFENAKQFNEEGSEVYRDAVELAKQARILAEEEKAKPDEDFRDEDGRLPLACIEYRGEIWRVGDWVHIRNPNDLSKPIVAQIFRTWSDANGQKWVNACWYYRPEQTVHRFDKHFFENEVVKTGQYRDHRIEDVEDRCFVMFITRYPRGRPRGLPPDKSVYVCKARYNEEKFKFNDIKTWTSCLPDEVRDKDYEMDLFDVPRTMRKVPSPIKHLLQADAKETDDLPKPTWRSPNAPPLIGAVHRRPREPNESPPPEPNPPPVAVARVPLAVAPTQTPIKANVGMAGTPTYHHPAATAPPPTPPPAHFQMQHFQPRPVPQPAPHQAPVHLQQQPQMTMHVPQHPGMTQMQPSPHYPPQAYPPQYGVQPQMAPQQVQYQTPAHIAPAFDQHHRPVHPAPQAMTPSRQPPASPAPSMTPHPHANTGHVYNVPRAPEVYTLADPVDAAIPADVREQFQRDEQGRVLFFTAPPLNRPANGVAEQHAGLGHSVRHLASISELRAERARKRKERDEALAREQEANKKLAASRERQAQRRQEDERKSQADALEKFLVAWAAEIDRGTKTINEALGDIENWNRIKHEVKEAHKNMTMEERRIKSLQWYVNWAKENGGMTEFLEKQFDDLIHRRGWKEEWKKEAEERRERLR